MVYNLYVLQFKCLWFLCLKLVKVFKDRGGMEKSMEKFFHDLNTFFLCPCFQNTIMVTSDSLQNEDTARGMEVMTPYTLHIQKKVT